MSSPFTSYSERQASWHPWNLLDFFLPRVSKNGIVHEHANGTNKTTTTQTKLTPIGSMYGIFTYIYHKKSATCRHIYHKWILWDRKTPCQSLHGKTVTTSKWCTFSTFLTRNASHRDDSPPFSFTRNSYRAEAAEQPGLSSTKAQMFFKRPVWPIVHVSLVVCIHGNGTHGNGKQELYI